MLISLAAAVIALIGLSRISSIVGPVFLALVLAICVYPLKQRLIARGVPAVLATISPILAVYAMIGALIASLWMSAVQLTKLLPQFAPQITELRFDLRVFLHDTLGIEEGPRGSRAAPRRNIGHGNGTEGDVPAGELLLSLILSFTGPVDSCGLA